MNGMKEVEVKDGFIEIFGRKFNADRAYRLPMANAVHSRLISIQCLIDRHMIDHMDEENTVLYLVEYNDELNLFWACSHFEGGSLLIINELLGIMSFMITMLCDEQSIHSAYIEVLDCVEEKLILSFEGVYRDIFL